LVCSGGRWGGTQPEGEGGGGLGGGGCWGRPLSRKKNEGGCARHTAGVSGPPAVLPLPAPPPARPANPGLTDAGQLALECQTETREDLQLAKDGCLNRDIAKKLDLSANTVAVHRANIMNALGLHKTAELVVYAIHHGLVTLP